MARLFNSEILSDFVSLFYPSYCLGCQNSLVKGEESVCTRCLLELPYANYHLDPENSIMKRLSGRIPVQQVLAFLKFSKNGRTQHLLHELKYKGHAEIGIMLGKVYGQKLKDSSFPISFDGILPVPLHSTRLRKRGYNQSSKFAEGLSEIWNVPVLDRIVVRKIKTETQTKKTKLRRWENVNDVFDVIDDSNLIGKHILITDDVITTGATVEALANTILKKVDVKISIASIAVA
jgi:ComF family protein